MDHFLEGNYGSQLAMHRGYVPLGTLRCYSGNCLMSGICIFGLSSKAQLSIVLLAISPAGISIKASLSTLMDLNVFFLWTIQNILVSLSILFFLPYLYIWWGRAQLRYSEITPVCDQGALQDVTNRTWVIQKQGKISYLVYYLTGLNICFYNLLKSLKCVFHSQIMQFFTELHIFNDLSNL